MIASTYSSIMWRLWRRVWNFQISKDGCDHKPRPDLILLDLNLPQMDGKDFLRWLKTDDQYETIPVVVLTSSVKETDVTDCYDLHADNFISKPEDLFDFT